jgi:hypothetical protein
MSLPGNLSYQSYRISVALVELDVKHVGVVLSYTSTDEVRRKTFVRVIIRRVWKIVENP